MEDSTGNCTKPNICRSLFNELLRAIQPGFRTTAKEDITSFSTRYFVCDETPDVKDVRTLMFGTPSQMGLLRACGRERRFSSRLKRSSEMALMLVMRMATGHKPSDEAVRIVANVIRTADEKTIVAMHLTAHEESSDPEVREAATEFLRLHVSEHEPEHVPEPAVQLAAPALSPSPSAISASGSTSAPISGFGSSPTASSPIGIDAASPPMAIVGVSSIRSRPHRPITSSSAMNSPCGGLFTVPRHLSPLDLPHSPPTASSPLHVALGNLPPQGQSNSLVSIPSLPPTPTGASALEGAQGGLGRLFGRTLDELAADGLFDKTCNVPLFLSTIVHHIVSSQELSETEGIFRAPPPGGDEDLAALKKELDAAPNDFDPSLFPPLTLAAGIKLWLSELPDPLVPAALAPRLIATFAEDDSTQVFELLNEIPGRSRDALQFLMAFCAHISGFKDKNRMTLLSLAVSLTPTIFKNRPSASLAEDMSFASGILRMLMESIIESAKELVDSDRAYITPSPPPPAVLEEEGEDEDEDDKLYATVSPLLNGATPMGPRRNLVLPRSLSPRSSVMTAGAGPGWWASAGTTQDAAGGRIVPRFSVRQSATSLTPTYVTSNLSRQLSCPAAPADRKGSSIACTIPASEMPPPASTTIAGSASVQLPSRFLAPSASQEAAAAAGSASPIARGSMIMGHTYVGSPGSIASSVVGGVGSVGDLSASASAGAGAGERTTIAAATTEGDVSATRATEGDMSLNDCDDGADGMHAANAAATAAALGNMYNPEQRCFNLSHLLGNTRVEDEDEDNIPPPPAHDDEGSSSEDGNDDDDDDDQSVAGSNHLGSSGMSGFSVPPSSTAMGVAVSSAFGYQSNSFCVPVSGAVPTKSATRPSRAPSMSPTSPQFLSAVVTRPTGLSLSASTQPASFSLVAPSEGTVPYYGPNGAELRSPTACAAGGFGPGPSSPSNVDSCASSSGGGGGVLSLAALNKDSQHPQSQQKQQLQTQPLVHQRSDTFARPSSYSVSKNTDSAGIPIVVTHTLPKTKAAPSAPGATVSRNSRRQRPTVVEPETSDRWEKLGDAAPLNSLRVVATRKHKDAAGHAVFDMPAVLRNISSGGHHGAPACGIAPGAAEVITEDPPSAEMSSRGRSDTVSGLPSASRNGSASSGRTGSGSFQSHRLAQMYGTEDGYPMPSPDDAGAVGDVNDALPLSAASVASRTASPFAAPSGSGSRSTSSSAPPAPPQGPAPTAEVGAVSQFTAAPSGVTASPAETLSLAPATPGFAALGATSAAAGSSCQASPALVPVSAPTSARSTTHALMSAAAAAAAVKAAAGRPVTRQGRSSSMAPRIKLPALPPVPVCEEDSAGEPAPSAAADVSATAAPLSAASEATAPSATDMPAAADGASTAASASTTEDAPIAVDAPDAAAEEPQVTPVESISPAPASDVSSVAEPAVVAEPASVASSVAETSDVASVAEPSATSSASEASSASSSSESSAAEPSGADEPAVAEAKPAKAKPTEAEPTEAKPAEAEPTEAEPTEAEPAAAEPTSLPSTDNAGSAEAAAVATAAAPVASASTPSSNKSSDNTPPCSSPCLSPATSGSLRDLSRSSSQIKAPVRQAPSRLSVKPTSAQLLDPIPTGWRRLTDPRGKTFYLHSATGQTSWVRPKV